MALVAEGIGPARLLNQHVTRQLFDTPAEVVRWMGAVQAQDYPGGLWAVGLRTPQATEASVEQALADRTIVRTWPMRGTLHLVPAEDARWMLKLLTPRVVSGSKGRLLRGFGLDDATFASARHLVERVLAGGKRITRPAIYALLEDAGITAGQQRGLHLLWWLAQEAVICLAARDGKQPTVALFDDWIPFSRDLQRDEALAEIAKRYFQSHGPATIRDFAWWTGLTLTDARAALEMVKSHLTEEVLGDTTYWLPGPTAPASAASPPRAFLLPPWDEFTVAYTDRRHALEAAHIGLASDFVLLGPIMVLDGHVIGSWRRSTQARSIAVTLRPFASVAESGRVALTEAALRFGAFHGKPAVVSWDPPQQK